MVTFVFGGTQINSNQVIAFNMGEREAGHYVLER